MLCGRVAEIARIEQLLNAARSGRSGVLALFGDGGVGKSTLLGHAETAATGMRVVRIQGSPPERNLAYAGISQLVSPRLEVLEQLSPAQADVLRSAVALGVPMPLDRFAVYAATLAFVAQLADRQPLLVTVDDYDWVDPGSAEAFAFVGRRLMAESIALLIAARRADGSDVLAGLPRHFIHGLDDADVAALIRGEAGVAPAEDVVRQLVRHTAGNPMAIREVLEHITEAQLTGTTPLRTLRPANLTARSLFARRVEACTAPARTLLLLLALSSGGSLKQVLDAAIGAGLTEDAIAEVEATGLISLEGNAFRFSHPLVRTAVVDTASPADRRQAHRWLAAALDEDDVSGQRVWHLADGTLGADETVAVMLDDLAERTRCRSGYAAAVAALERAALLSETEASRARRLYVAAFDAQLAGSTEQAQALLVAADALAHDTELRNLIAARRGWVELVAGRPAVAHRIVRRAADAAAETDPLRLQLLTDAAITALLAGDTSAALDAIAQADKTQTPHTATSMLVVKAWHGMVQLHLGNVVEGLALIREASAIASLPRAERPSPDYVIMVAYGMTWIGMHREALAMLAPVVAEARAAGALGLLPFALSITAQAEARAGRLAAARSTAMEAVELSRLVDSGFWRYLALSAAATVLAIRGEEDDCRRHVAEAIALQSAGTDYPRDASEALALLELGLGHYEAAIEAFRAAPSATGRRTAEDETHPDFVEAYLRVNRKPTASTRARLDDLAGAGAAPLHAAIALRLQGLAADNADYPARFEAALREHDLVPCPFEKARTLLAFGERVRRAGLRTEARRHLRPALDIFDTIGARSWALRAQAELTATGESVRERRATSAIDELTSQEYQVARLAVSGASNKEVAAAMFLSAKTVEYHLGHIYRKLGVRSRTELSHRHPGLADG
jgi:DNA-binding CsgD family transcriptional regulator